MGAGCARLPLTREDFGQEWIDQLHARTFEISGIARHYRQVTHQGGRRDLFIPLVSGVWDPQATPHLRRIGFEREDVLPILIEDRRQPRVQPLCLIRVAAMADEFDATTKFSDRNRGKIDRLAGSSDAIEKSCDSRIGPVFFRASLTTLVSIKYTWRILAGLHALEICIYADIGD